MKYKLVTHSKQLLADTITPVNIYLKLRDVFAGSILLESSDYHGHENSLSFICCEPIASIKVQDNKIETRYPDHSKYTVEITSRSQVLATLDEFRQSFEADPIRGKYSPSGLFGYMGYDALRYFEEIDLTIRENLVPEIIYKVYRFVIVVDHFSNVLVLFETCASGTEDRELEKVERIIYSNRFPTFPFHASGPEESNVTDEEFLQMVDVAKKHCYRGDVFQMVLSRRYTRGFKGDEFNVYRALRSINPSPYLFYFDYGNFKLFGSSPETQLQIKDGKASIYPIAGTFRRSGNDKEDSELAHKLTQDEKENAEHVMLVDLARNDLSRDSCEVQVEVFKQIQYYSHVIHLVSKVTGKLRDDMSPLKLATDTFPAGTLSGAPKHKAITLIDKYENINRSFYGGAIGFMSFQGDFNHAIMIRTFLSKDCKLICQAGAGIVAKSVAQNELLEVNNKLAALRMAVQMAGKI